MYTWIYLVKYSQQILISVFEMSHFNLLLSLITVNILIPGYNLPVLTILLFYILTYELNYKANYHLILFKFIIYILAYPLLYILSIQDNNQVLSGLVVSKFGI